MMELWEFLRKVNNACLAIQNALPSLKQVLWTDKPNYVFLVGIDDIVFIEQVVYRMGFFHYLLLLHFYGLSLVIWAIRTTNFRQASFIPESNTHSISSSV